MSVEIIRIIRELTDTGKSTRKPHSYLCMDADYNCRVWEPNTDIWESEDSVCILVELAGVQKEDITVKIKNSKIFISGQRKEKRPDQQIRFHQLEINYGAFLKIIRLPETLEHNEIVAKFQSGFLLVEISKVGKVVEIPIVMDLNDL